ncbi:MAG: beta-ketoacyl synthase N-terminal-like domain-containing protein, partial [Roseiflexaceae bacterium]
MQEQISRATSPIAIIGMASIFPEARTLDEFWDNIVQARDCLRDVPASRWNIDDYYDANPAAPDKTYCKRGGFIPDIDFDPVEFGLPPNILEVTDVSQLLGLLVARQTFDDAGYGRAGREFDRERTGVVLGVGGGQKLITPLTTRLQYPVWERVLRSSGLSETETAVIVEKLKSAYVGWEENSFPGLLGNVIAGRIANRFDLGGINCVVDAACAASLAALKLAISELTERRCDLMLTGGVDTDNSIFMYMSFSKTPAFSAQQAPRPFDAESDGMMVGEGLGMLLLKRLDDAERDGDRIYAVIRGIGSSSDGRAKSIYAPRSEGQARALRRAYADAGVELASVGLIEAHGTGTVAGDICEATTLVDVFSTAGAGQATVALGSIKSQIGHTKAAAGAAGLIKAALALHHKVLPPTLNVTAPNPMLGLEHSPLYLNTEARPWLRGGTARRAGVSAFGFGGTNFHVVLEEHELDHEDAYRRHAAACELLIHASTSEALQTRCAELAAALAGDAATFADLYRESGRARPDADAARLGFVASSAAEASQLLQLAAEALTAQPAAEAWAHPRGIFYRRRALAAGAKVIALFAGQGAQQIGMGRELALNYPVVRRWFERLDLLFVRDGRQALSRTVFPPPTFAVGGRERQAEALQQTEYAQPAIGALSAAMFDLFRRAGFRPDAVAGHSFGELTALWAAGAIGDDDYAALAYARGQAMRAPADPSFDAGTMLAVAAGRTVVDELVGQIAGLTIANQNAPEQVVLAGPRPAVAAAARMLADRGIMTTPLPVSAAFHTPLMGHAQAPFAAAVAAATVRTPQLPIYANSTAAPYPAEPDAIKAQLAGQLLRPVQFQQQIERMYADGGAIFVEFGPRNILTGLVHQTLGARPHLAVALGASRGRDSDRQLREGLIQLRVAGLPLGPCDTYRYEQAVAAPLRRGMRVQINGSNFVSERTRAAHAAALSDGFRIVRDAPSDSHEQKRVDTSMPDSTRSSMSATVTTPPVPAPTAAIPPVLAIAPAGAPLERIYEHQREVLQLQQLYMSHQAEYAHAFMQLLQEQQRLLLEHGAQVSPAALEHLERSVMAFHQHQGETLRLHERYLADQHSYAERLLALAVAAVVPAVAAPAARLSEPLAPEVLRIAGVATQQSGNGHKPAPAPALPPVEYGGNSHHAPPARYPAAEAPAVLATPAALPPLTTAAPVADPAALAHATNTLLEVVTELTGYPRETLELDMDMESDLGIDSIKRVQILGAMQERLTALPAFKPETLAELRTLGQVLDHVRPHLAAATSAPIAAILAP